MEIKTFINNYKEAFGKFVQLPIVFWYSNSPIANTEKINGCLFKGMEIVEKGESISLSINTIGCGGGKFYACFTKMPERVPNFVSIQEKYKKTPEMVLEFVDNLSFEPTTQNYINFTRIDNIDSFENIEGILFFATPDILSGLTAWAYFDNNSEDAVSSIFGSGCSSVITQALIENKKNGRRTFIGCFDPSVRPYLKANTLSFVIPISRFKEMYFTMRNTCLFNTHAWNKVRERINLN